MSKCKMQEIRRGRKNIESEKKDKFSIKVINIQGCSKTKIAEVEELLEEKKDSICLKETQHKEEKTKLNENILKHVSMRDLADKKWGELMVLYRQDRGINLRTETAKNKDYT